MSHCYKYNSVYLFSYHSNPCLHFVEFLDSLERFEHLGLTITMIINMYTQRQKL
jgi:hypothetical protein